MAPQQLKTWNHGQKLGIGVFLFLMIVLKLVEENMIPKNWQLFATQLACLIAWQVVVVAYRRGWSEGCKSEGRSR